MKPEHKKFKFGWKLNPVYCNATHWTTNHPCINRMYMVAESSWLNCHQLKKGCFISGSKLDTIWWSFMAGYCVLRTWNIKWYRYTENLHMLCNDLHLMVQRPTVALILSKVTSGQNLIIVIIAYLCLNLNIKSNQYRQICIFYAMICTARRH